MNRWQLLRWIAAASCAVLFLSTPRLFAASFESRHAGDLARNPLDVSVVLRTTKGQRAFHPGERIPLTVELSSASPEKYRLLGGRYDSSGRLLVDEFIADQEVVDPYRDYFGAAMLDAIALVLHANPVLERKPYKVEADLNDWFRFDRPGRYRLYLKSHRLLRRAPAPGAAGGGGVHFPSVSNIVDIEILPQSSAWETAKLREIQEILDSAGPEAPRPGHPLTTDDAIRRRLAWEEKVSIAYRELRYLGTSGAVQLALVRARQGAGRPEPRLLFGARNRRQAAAALDEYLADPRVGIYAEDIRTRALFTFFEKDAPEPLPFSRRQFLDLSELKKQQPSLEARRKRCEALARAEAIRLIPVAAKKSGAARKTSAEAIAFIAPDAAKAARLVPPDD